MYSTACRLDEWVPLGEAETSKIVPRQLRGALAGATEDAKRKMLRKVWARADADNSGSLDRDEVRAVLIEMGHDPEELDMEQTMSELDEDGACGVGVRGRMGCGGLWPWLTLLARSLRRLLLLLRDASSCTSLCSAYDLTPTDHVLA